VASAVTASAQLLAASLVLATADAAGAPLLALWLVLPVALAAAEGRPRRLLWETAALTALAVAALAFAGVVGARELDWPGGWSYGGLPIAVGLGAAFVTALAVGRRVLVQPHLRAGANDAPRSELAAALAAAERERDALETAVADRSRFFASMSHELR